MKKTNPYTALEHSKGSLPIAIIDHGTVLDHISAGKAMLLLRLLKLEAEHRQITVGLNLPSTRFKRKDIIKVEGWELSPSEASQVAIFSPHTTVSIIKDFKVADKFSVVRPDVLEGAVCCPNRSCITNHESADRFFYVAEVRKEVLLCCKYCERVFHLHEILQFAV